MSKKQKNRANVLLLFITILEMLDNAIRQENTLMQFAMWG